MIDFQAMNDRLSYIRTALERLRARRALSKEALEADPDKRGATFYDLQTCIEAMSDIANHIIAATGLRKPQDRGPVFHILAEAGILPHDLAARLAEAVRMRNVLVHGYLDVALEPVYETLQNDLPDIEAFTQQIVAYLQGLQHEQER